ncbi:hypothetical protein KQH61_04100 [bacterium]|nr:hypothetical protein [bacterium]MCB2179085.1 hypothetical protein [bacterium]
MALGQSTNRNLFQAIWPQILDNFGKVRWWLPVIIALINGSSETNRLLLQQQISGFSFNIWDVIFSLISNGNYVLYVANFLFLFLVFDLINENSFDQHILHHLGSRQNWWRSKVALLGFSVLTFAFLSFGIVLGIAKFSFPWQPNWSAGAQVSPEFVYLTPRVLEFSPIEAFFKSFFLLFMGWFGLGLFVMFFAIITGASIKGFFAGVGLNILGIVIYKALILVPPWFVNLTYTQRMILHFHYLDTEGLTFFQTIGFSLMYFLSWSILFYGGGAWVSRHKEFFGGRSA